MKTTTQKRLIAALTTLVDHAQEAYPHFEDTRGQNDIAEALSALEEAQAGHAKAQNVIGFLEALAGTDDEPRDLTLRESTNALRKALKAAFPDTKFSVTTGRGTATGNVYVSWTSWTRDAPTGHAVRAIVYPFEGRTFDGRDDSTVIKHALVVVDGESVRSRCGMILLERNGFCV